MRERLAATLRAAGQLDEAAAILHALLPELEGDAAVAGLHLDLGSIIDELAPISGAGAEWVAARDRQTEPLSSPTLLLGSGEAAEQLSAEACYMRAIAADPDWGEAHKR